MVPTVLIQCCAVVGLLGVMVLYSRERGSHRGPWASVLGRDRATTIVNHARPALRSTAHLQSRNPLKLPGDKAGAPTTLCGGTFTSNSTGVTPSGYDTAACWGHRTVRTPRDAKFTPACPDLNELSPPSNTLTSPRRGHSTTPFGPDWRNISAASARQMLRGSTVIFAGDSTSRRLFWAMCMFLTTDDPIIDVANLSQPYTGKVSLRDRWADFVNGGLCCGTKRVIKYCDEQSLAHDHDIVLLNTPCLRTSNTLDWFDSTQALATVRATESFWDAKGTLSLSMPAMHPPRNPDATATFMVGMVGPTYHDTRCSGEIPNATEWMHNTKWTPDPGTPGDCDNELILTPQVRHAMGSIPEDPSARMWGAACGTIASFWARANAASAAAARKHSTVSFHGLLPFPAPKINRPKPMAEGNVGRLALAAVAAGAGCSRDLELAMAREAQQTRCRFIDQMSWLLPGNESSRRTAWQQALNGDLQGANATLTEAAPAARGWERTACAPADGHTPHIYDPAVIAIRVQAVLNSIAASMS
jgi:hypothetical protein